MILAVADELGVGGAGRLIGTMVALAESDLYQQANANNPLSLTLPHDRVGKDADSLGLFQQRTRWWGTGSEDERVRQLMDAKQSARLFFQALQRVSGWRGMDPWIAAQYVQRSSFDGVIAIDPKTGKPFPFGQNYRDRMNQAAAAIAGQPDHYTRTGGR